MGSRKYKDSAEVQGVSCHENGEIAGQGGDDRDRAWRQTWRPGTEAGHGGRER